MIPRWCIVNRDMTSQRHNLNVNKSFSLKKGMWYMNKNFLYLWLRSITAVLHHFVAAVLVEILTICATSHYLQTRKYTTSSAEMDKRQSKSFNCCPNTMSMTILFLLLFIVFVLWLFAVVLPVKVVGSNWDKLIILVFHDSQCQEINRSMHKTLFNFWWIKLILAMSMQKVWLKTAENTAAWRLSGSETPV